MNATLQCLCHIDSLKDYFNENINNINQSTPLTKQFLEVITNLWKPTTLSSYAPHNFKNQISIMNPLFKGIQANDSKDLILFIFETIHNELNNPSQNTTPINYNNIPKELVAFRQNYYSQNYSIISKTFYYEQSNVMKCASCGFETLNFNIMNCLIFPLEKVRLYMEKQKLQGFRAVTLNNCFEQFEQPELLSGANQIYCNNCHQNTNGYSYNKIYNTPEVLTIILNRGKGIQFNVIFNFPMNMNIQGYIADKTCYSNYELIGVLTHHGPSGMAGHFVAYCKSPIDGNWYFYNDSIVTKCGDKVEEEMLSNGIPYILFYQKRMRGNNMNYPKLNENNNITYENNNITYENNNINYEKKEKHKKKVKKCIYPIYDGKEVYYEYDDDNKMLYEMKNELCKKYEWIPRDQTKCFLMKDEKMIDLDDYKSFSQNGIHDGDKICIVKV